MNKYLVLTAGQTFLVKAEKITMTDKGTIEMHNGNELLCALPHGASVMKEDSIQKPETPTIHKV